MESLFEAERVFEQLGKPTDLLELIDNPPDLKLKKQVKIRLNSLTSEPIDSIFYIFDRLLIVAVSAKEGEPEDSNGQNLTTLKSSNLIWFGERYTEEHESVIWTDQEGETDIQEEIENEYPVETGEPLNLKCFMDLSRINPEFFTVEVSENSNMGMIKCTYIDWVQNKNVIPLDILEDPFLITVGESYFWIEDIDMAIKIMGYIQESCKFARNEISYGLGLSKSRTETDTRSVISSSSRGNVVKEPGRSASKNGDLKHIIEKRRSTTDKLSDQSSPRRQTYETGSKRGSIDEMGTYGVYFQCAPNGIYLGQRPSSLVEVKAVEEKSVADRAGIVRGDSLVYINNIKIKQGHDVEKIIQIMKNAHAESGELYLILKRSRTIEMNHSQMSEMDRNAVKISFDDITPENISLKQEIIVKKSSAKLKTGIATGLGASLKELSFIIQVVSQDTRATSKTMKGRRRGKTLNATSKRQTRKQKSIAGIVDDDDESVQSLFQKMLQRIKNGKEKACIYSLKEIYETEGKYLEELQILLDARDTLSKLKKYAKCMDLKTGRPFCEHYRVRQFCKQESKVRVRAVEDKDLDSIFLNIKSLYKLNERIFSDLRQKLNNLYYENEAEDITVEDILESFCSVIIQIAPFLSMYTQFIQRYSGAVTKQRMLREENWVFNEYVTQIENKYKMSFTSLINKPLHRVTKYSLLFETLRGYVRKYVKFALEDGDEENAEVKDAEDKVETGRFDKILNDLDRACDIVKVTMDKVNQKVGHAEGHEKLVKVVDELGGPLANPDLLQPWRRLVNRFSDIDYQHGSLSTDLYEDVIVFMFNDILVVAMEKTAYKAVKNTMSSSSSKDQAGAVKRSMAKLKSGVVTASQLFRNSKPKGTGKSNSKNEKVNSKNTRSKAPRRRITGSFRISTSTLKRKKRSKSIRDSISSSTRKLRRGSLRSSFSLSRGSNGEKEKKQTVSLVIVQTINISEMNKEREQHKPESGTRAYGILYSVDNKSSSLVDNRAAFWLDTEESSESFASTIEKLKSEYESRQKAFENAKNGGVSNNRSGISKEL